MLGRISLLTVVTLLAGFSAARAADMKLGREPDDPVARGELPQYIFFNKAPSHPDPMRWYQGDPNTFTPGSCEEIVKLVGVRGNRRLSVGVSFIFSLMENSRTTWLGVSSVCWIQPGRPTFPY